VALNFPPEQKIMSLTKRWMEADAEAETAKEKAECGCRFNWDDKYEELCPKHQAEEDERQHHEQQ
jgi:hypothetical protein